MIYSPSLPNFLTSFNSRTTTPRSLRRPSVFFPRTCVREMEALPTWLMRRMHDRHVGDLPTRGDAMIM